jgi:hypothetical protein
MWEGKLSFFTTLFYLILLGLFFFITFADKIEPIY